ncbi:MAG: polysaccharide biosynthesis tyrosine autokinase [Zavarzinella sp.]
MFDNKNSALKPRTASSAVVPYAQATETHARPTSNTPPLTVLHLIGCLRRRWKQAAILGTIAAGMISVFVFWFLPPARPYAYTKLYFQSKPAGTVDRPDPPVKPSTQKELVASRIVLQEVFDGEKVKNLEIVREKTDPYEWLIRELRVEFPTESEIMRIELADNRVEEAKILVDELARVYMARIANESAEYRKTMYTKLKDEIKRLETEYLKTFDKAGDPESATLDPAVMAQRLQWRGSEITRMRADVQAYKDRASEIRTELTILNERLKKRPIELTPGEYDKLLASNPTVQNLKQSRIALQQMYDRESLGLDPTHTRMVGLKNQLKQVDDQLEAVRKGLSSASIEENLRDAATKLQAEINKYDLTIRSKDAELGLAIKEYEKMASSSGALSRDKPKFLASGSQLEEMRKRLSLLEMDLNAPFGVKPLEHEAVIVRPNDASRRMKLTMVAAAGTFGMVVLLLCFMEFRAYRISSPSEVVENLGLRVYGTVPAQPKRITGRTFRDDEWEAIIAESVDSARTIFLHSAMAKNLRTVMVTSAVEGEGKTTFSCRLADSLARSGRKTLLIDMDLRNPSVHAQFGMSPGPGVCEILRGQVLVHNAIQPTTLDTLSILTAGSCDRFAIEALSMPQLTVMLNSLQQQYDFILIDSSPVLPVADTLLVAKHVDGVLFSLMQDHSKIDRVHAATEKLASIDVPLLGAIVNGTRGESYGYATAYSPAGSAG